MQLNKSNIVDKYKTYKYVVNPAPVVVLCLSSVPLLVTSKVSLQSPFLILISLFNWGYHGCMVINNPQGWVTSPLTRVINSNYQKGFPKVKQTTDHTNIKYPTALVRYNIVAPAQVGYQITAQRIVFVREMGSGQMMRRQRWLFILYQDFEW